MKNIQKILILILGISLSLSLFLLIFESYAFNEHYFAENFLDLNVAEQIGVSEEDLLNVTHELVTHIDTGEGNLYVSAEVHGRRVIFFNHKERVHLNDIFILAESGRQFLFYIQVVTIVSILGLFFTSGGRMKPFLSVLGTTLITSLLFLGSLVVLYFVDFTKAFHQFHELFFSNDYWLLDPSKDRLIQMMPLQFFINFTSQWLRNTALAHLAILILYVIGKKHIKKPSAEA
ncbi:TIGR01906 family membrane protein [Fusibacter tunisiensis]|uniref:Integral membrane protein (TIGR01906 family) n=1 Tax=Fusibacter tunisiensis TaxID=1008308 RepID=A0ABS2MS55_9FIRM|nr:TIGR01906 family membrane protein [Fusibacter tunisiensis]MBM7562254.1 integral membrane protein (TIGR01906 family) [Fusibacter tunisiensis]